jgi:Protein of unknown function (DUF2778)
MRTNHFRRHKLTAASIAVLVVTFAVASHAIGSGSAKLQTERETEFHSAVGQTERTAEPIANGTPYATFDERFYFDQRSASFDERFANAFEPSRDATEEISAAEVHDDNVVPQELNKPIAAQSIVTPEAASRHASVRAKGLDPAEASISLRRRLDSDGRTAIYDIAAHTVYLPNGNRLEAHSGLGSLLDDPRYVKTKGQGSTPPNVYNLALREQLFHGVQAIRLIPINDEKMFGRDGILAHTYMLGRSGQSNGCVSFRNYSLFLGAFLKGEVKRLVVVDHLSTTLAMAISRH